MTQAATNPTTNESSDGKFAPTHWTVVLAARGQDTHLAREALETLCRTYWYPLYAYVRRRGSGVAEAEDLTQEFFARVLAKNYLTGADRRKGKFRSFLLASLKHFLANEWDRASAQKRGGGGVLVSRDMQTAETGYRQEPVEHLTPEKLFDRQWALVLLNQVLTQLQTEFAAAGKVKEFEQMKAFLTEGKGAISYAAVAAKLGTTEGAAKVAVHRLRRRYRELLRSEIARTVAGPEEVEEELRSLYAAFGS